MKLLKGLLVVALLMLTACSTDRQENVDEPIKILAPIGATSLSMLGLYGDEQVTIDTVDGSDVLSAQLADKHSEYDAIIAPINVGAKLAAGNKSEYMLGYIVTWGNLYIVGSDETALTGEGTFAAFGELAVPQKVLLSSMDMTTIKPEVVYFNSANDVASQLMSGQANVGLLAEPAVTTLLAKAKDSGKQLEVLVDLQQAYKEKNGAETLGYPQAALFIKKGSEASMTPYIEKAMTFTNETAISNPDEIIKAVNVATTDTLGIPDATIAQNSWTRQNIRIVKAIEVKPEVEQFLKQFELTIDDSIYVK